MLDEKSYRLLVAEAFEKILKRLENEDPDVLEADAAAGALTIIAKDRSKTILSPQPSVRQLWLAAASQGRAYHFVWQEKAAQWIDEKNNGSELYQTLQEILLKNSGKLINF